MYNLRMTAKTIYYDHDDNNDMKEKYWILPIFGFGDRMMMMMLVVTNVSLQLQYVICKPKRLPFNSCCFLLPFFRPYPYPMYLISFLLFVNDGEARVCSVAEVVYQTLWMATERSLWSAVGSQGIQNRESCSKLKYLHHHRSYIVKTMALRE